MRVFCIGFNKTGTSSLHRFFLRSGLRSVHSDRWTAWSWLPNGCQELNRYEAYTDGEQCDFRQLKEWFPEGVFILNTRGDGDWLRSRVKHVLRLGRFSGCDALRNAMLGRMAREYFADPRMAIQKWILEKRLFEAQARLFFLNDPVFLELDVTVSANWQLRLARHLEQFGLLVPRETWSTPIHANPSQQLPPDDYNDLSANFKLIDSLRSTSGSSCH